MNNTKIFCSCCIFGIDKKEIKILLSQHENGKWIIPEGSLTTDKSAEESIIDILKTKFDIRPRFVDQVYTFTNVERYPNERAVSIVFFTIIDSDEFIKGIGTDKAEWFNFDKYPDMAFDHDTILKMAIGKLELKIRESLSNLAKSKNTKQ